MGISRGIPPGQEVCALEGVWGLRCSKKTRQPTQPSKQPIIETTGKIQRGTDSTEL